MDKVVKGATKPKDASPKAKYVDAIIQATYAGDGSLQDCCRALATRLRDPNTLIVFKALLVIHTLIRAGSLRETLGYLSSDPGILGLRETASRQSAFPYIAAYSMYLHVRLKTYASLGHDVIRDYSDRQRAGRLRKLTVEKGLLREVGHVQKLHSALVQGKFYLDDTDDDIGMSAFRLLVKDLLILFQALNEGIINILEHYFEMSHVDATQALKIYRSFCNDTEKCFEYLAAARRLQNIINISIPNLKHAPVSLVQKLEEYLNDPQFETNRQEYKENRRIADGEIPPRQAPKSSSGPEQKPAAATTPQPEAQPAQQSSPVGATEANKPFIDFFESIEQSSMFGPATTSQPAGALYPQGTGNPFSFGPGGFQPTATQFPQPATSLHNPANPFPPAANSFQPFAQPNFTGSQQGANPFTTTPLAPQATSFNPFNQSDYATQQPSFLQAQVTGNPFRNSTMPLQPTMTGSGNPFSLQSGQPSLGAQTGHSAFSPQLGQSHFGFASTGGDSQSLQTVNPAALAFTSTGVSPTSSVPTQIAPMPSSLTTSMAPQATGSNNPFGRSSSSPTTDLGKAHVQQNGSLMSEIASSFIAPTKDGEQEQAGQGTSQGQAVLPSTNSWTSQESSVSTTSPLSSQPTGTRKPFVPQSSFGKSLLSGSIPETSPSTTQPPSTASSLLM